MRYVGDGLDVDNLKCRVAGRLEVHNFCFFGQCRLKIVRVRKIMEGGRNFEAPELVREQRERAPVKRLVGDDFIAR